MRSRFFNTLIIGYFTIAPAMADPVSPSSTPAPFNFAGRYECTLSGLLVGTLGIEAHQTSSQYTLTSDISTAGIAKLFVKHTSHTTAQGEGNHFTYPRITYESHYQTRKKKKYVHMTFAKNTITEETLIPPDNRATRPAVDDDLKDNAVDPLTLLLRMREAVAKAMAAGQSSFTINYYDGRRLTRLDFTLLGHQSIRYQDTKTLVVAVDVKRSYIAGFTQSELDDYDPKEPPLHIYFSDDAKLIPIKLEISLWMGTLTANLVKECGNGESCLLALPIIALPEAN